MAVFPNTGSGRHFAKLVDLRSVGYYCSRNRIRAALLRDRSVLLRVTSRYFALLRVTSRYFARNNNETIIPQVSSQARTRASPKHVTCRYSAYFMGAYLLVTARWSKRSGTTYTYECDGYD